MRAWIQHSIEDSAEVGNHKFIMIPINKRIPFSSSRQFMREKEQEKWTDLSQIVSKTEKTKTSGVEYAGSSVSQTS